MDFPLLDLMDEQACYDKLLQLLHPEGLACPKCHARQGLGVHRRYREPILDYQCSKCRCVFNLFTGTAFQSLRRSAATLCLILRGIAQGTPTAQLARELGCSRPKLLRLRHRLQQFACQAVDRRTLPDAITEADEMFQNAGEKRHSAHRPRRSPTPACQQSARPRHLG